MPPREQALACLPHGPLERPYNDFQAPALPSRATLALCATPEEVARVVETRQLEPDALVAATPHAAHECERRGRAYLAVEDFYDVTAFLDADEPMLALQRRWADRVDAFAWEALPELERYGLRPAGHYVFFLKVLIDTLYRAAFELAHVLRATQSGRIVFFDDRLGDPVTETLFFPRPVHPALLRAFSEVYGVEPAPLPPVPQARQAPTVGRGIGPTLERVLSPRAVTRLRAVRHAGLHGLVPGRPRADGRAEIVCGRGYDVDLVAARLAADGYRISPLVEPLRVALGGGRRRREHLRRSLAELWPQLRAEPFFSEPFRWAGADVLPLADARLEHWWTRVVPAMLDTLIRSRTRFERDPPRAVVLYSPWSPEDHGALQGARSLGIPTITHQHGGFEGNCEYTTYDLTDLRLADHRLVYGESAAAYFRQRATRAGEVGARIVPTGSGRLDALRRTPASPAGVRDLLGVPAGRPLVLYVAASYQQQGWYLCRGAYLGVPYYRLLTQLVGLFARMPHVHVVYKPFPARRRDPVVGLVERDAPNASVAEGIPMAALLAASDAFVVDIPSTALLEALLSPKPMLTYADARFVSLLPEARELLRRRAVVAETPDALVAELEAFLSRDSFEPLADPDDAFLRAYGTHLDDGRSAERAARCVLEIAAAHRRAAKTRR